MNLLKLWRFVLIKRKLRFHFLKWTFIWRNNYFFLPRIVNFFRFFLNAKRYIIGSRPRELIINNAMNQGFWEFFAECHNPNPFQIILHANVKYNIGGVIIVMSIDSNAILIYFSWWIKRYLFIDSTSLDVMRSGCLF